MKEVRIPDKDGGIVYSIGRLDCFKQLHVARRIAPMLTELKEALQKSGELELDDLVASSLAATFSKMSNADVDYILNTCLAVCKRQQIGGWADVQIESAGRYRLMFEDLSMDELLALAIAVMTENLGDFFPIAQPQSQTKV
jgi:hypothetical protein